jgi:hypothetical protein
MRKPRPADSRCDLSVIEISSGTRVMTEERLPASPEEAWLMHNA